MRLVVAVVAAVAAVVVVGSVHLETPFVVDVSTPVVAVRPSVPYLQ